MDIISYKLGQKSGGGSTPTGNYVPVEATKNDFTGTITNDGSEVITSSVGETDLGNELSATLNVHGEYGEIYGAVVCGDEGGNSGCDINFSAQGDTAGASISMFPSYLELSSIDSDANKSAVLNIDGSNGYITINASDGVRCSQTPTDDDDIANKKYVDDNLGQLKKITQDTNLYELENGIYEVDDPNIKLYYRSGTTNYIGIRGYIALSFTNTNDANFNFVASYLKYNTHNGGGSMPNGFGYGRAHNSGHTEIYINQTAKISYTDVNEWINGKKTFNTLPESSITPTTNNQLVNKKYVDDYLTTITGYDATKTQVLKNVSGVFTWVDE